VRGQATNGIPPRAIIEGDFAEERAVRKSNLDRSQTSVHFRDPACRGTHRGGSSVRGRGQLDADSQVGTLPVLPPPAARVALLTLLHSADPEALLAHAAGPFCTPGRQTGRLPLLAVRQGGIRDELQERAACAGSAGWLGAPVVVFAELPALLAGDLAPLTSFERRVLLETLLDRMALRALANARARRGVIETLDRLFGNLISERTPPEEITTSCPSEADAWEVRRDEDLAALYAAYIDAVAALQPVNGVPRSDGRDGRTLAAEAIRARPDEVRRRLRRPFGSSDEPVTIVVYGLNDLRRGWDRLLDALRAAAFIDEVRVYVPLDEVQGAGAAAEREAMEAIGEHELLDALLTRSPDHLVRVLAQDIESSSGLAPLRRALLRADATELAPTGDSSVRALSAPDMARELETVARRVKQLVVDEGVAPHRIAVVSRKSRPYGPRAVDVLRRHGVPVTARLRTNLTEVAAVAALLRVFAAAATGFPWRTLAELAESPFFALDLDAGMLKRASASGGHRSLGAWAAALDDLVAEAQHAEQTGNGNGHRLPPLARAKRAAESFAAFRATAEPFAVSRPRADWITLALRCLGCEAGGERSPAFREGLWGFARHAYRPPHDERDVLLVDAVRRDAAALDGLGELLVEWHGALSLRAEAAGEVLSPAAWHAELLDALTDVESVISTPHRRGVQVLEASAAVWRTFDHLFLVGMSAGDFPAEPTGRELFAESERETRYTAGLPLDPARVWFAREASLFRMLVGGTRRSLHVSYAHADAAGATQIPSAYFDEIVSRFEPSPVETVQGSQVAPRTLDDVWCADDLVLFAARRWADTTARARAEAERALAQVASDGDRRALLERVLRAAHVEHERRAMRLAPPGNRTDVTRPWNGAITSPDLVAALAARYADTVWSASQLETYGRCPFTFFASYVLDVRGLEEPDEDMDGRTRGELLHVCLERVHSRLAADLGDDALTTAGLSRAAKVIPDVVRRTLSEFEATGHGGVRALRAVRERELVTLLDTYLRWEVAENEKPQRRATPRRRPLQTQVVFGMRGQPPVSLERGGRVLKLRGTIDRVDALTEPEVLGWRYVVDHKTSDAALKPLDLYDEGAVLQLPLYIHALERLDRDATGVWGGAYQIVKDDCKRAAALHPRTLDRGRIREGSNKTEQTAASRLHDAVDLALGHVDGVRGGAFPARIPTCVTSCPPFCGMTDVCREDRAARGGPKR
jgi:ATP-dependent helicase/nuclease subunit B